MVILCHQVFLAPSDHIDFLSDNVSLPWSFRSSNGVLNQHYKLNLSILLAVFFLSKSMSSWDNLNLIICALRMTFGLICLMIHWLFFLVIHSIFNIWEEESVNKKKSTKGFKKRMQYLKMEYGSRQQWWTILKQHTQKPRMPSLNHRK